MSLGEAEEAKEDVMAPSVSVSTFPKAVPQQQVQLQQQQPQPPAEPAPEADTSPEAAAPLPATGLGHSQGESLEFPHI